MQHKDRARKLQRFSDENAILRSKIKELEGADGLLDPNLFGLKKSVKELDHYYRFYKEHTEQLISEPVVDKQELIELLEALINVIKTNEHDVDYFTNDKQASSLNNRHSLGVFVSQLKKKAA